MKRNLIIAKLFILVMLIHSVEIAKATEFSTPMGARSAGLANCAVSLDGFWSVGNNPAGLAGMQNISAGFFYTNRFLVKQLSTKGGGVVVPTKSGVFGLNLLYFGYSNYNESKVGLSYARPLGKHLDIGLTLDYLATRIAEVYGNKSMVTFELGIRSKLTDDLVIAAFVFNPIGIRLENTFDERIPVVFRLGAAYKISDEILLTIETEKDTEFKPLFRGGMEYVLMEKYSFRLGYSTLPPKTGDEKLSIASLITFGFGLEFNKLNIDFAASMHQTLGWSPGVSMYYKF
jgi:hypothetical protein